MPDGKTNRNGGAPALRGHVVDAFAEDLLRAVARGLRIPPEFLNMVPVDHRLAWAQTTRDMHISRGPVREQSLQQTLHDMQIDELVHGMRVVRLPLNQPVDHAHVRGRSVSASPNQQQVNKPTKEYRDMYEIEVKPVLNGYIILAGGQVLVAADVSATVNLVYSMLNNFVGTFTREVKASPNRKGLSLSEDSKPESPYGGMDDAPEAMEMAAGLAIAPAPAHSRFYRMRIRPTLNGWLVKIGCQRLCYTDPDKLVEDLREYLENPSKKAAALLKAAVNREVTMGPGQEPVGLAAAAEQEPRG